MIPRIVHWCWLSNEPIPDKFKVYMSGWKQKLLNYEFIHWDLKRFPLEKSIWVKQASENKKYAFAADYIRLYALYKYGGFYLDMDVEIKKPFDDLLKLPVVLCWQKDIGGLEVAAFGAPKGSSIIKECLDRYENRQFVKENGELDTNVLPNIVENTLKDKGYIFIDVKSIDEALTIDTPYHIPVFPCDFFSPKSYKTGKIEISNNTYCIHHFSGSWKKGYEKMEHHFWSMLGMKNYCIINRTIKLLRMN